MLEQDPTGHLYTAMPMKRAEGAKIHGGCCCRWQHRSGWGGVHAGNVQVGLAGRRPCRARPVRQELPPRGHSST